MRIAKRIVELPAYVFAEADRKLSALKAKGVDIIDLGIGSPDLAPPRHIVEALCRSAQQSDTHAYAGFYGIPALRAAIAGYYSARFGVQLNPDREIVTLIGSKEGIFNVAQAFVDPGDVMLVPDPGYPVYSMSCLMAGGVVYPFPLREGETYLPNLDAIPADVAAAAKLLWLNYPNNPTGAVADLAFLSRAVDYARCNDLLICYDNPYCDLTFDGYRAPSILQVPGAKDVALEFNSLSKTYNMAGWRVGMAVGNSSAVEALSRVKTNIDSGIFKSIQQAAVAALTGDQTWVVERNAIYQSRRDVIMGFLPAAGLSANVPRAAMYVWARIPAGEHSAEYSARLLDRTGVWMTPGSAFGVCGDGYVRIALTVTEDRLRQAGERLQRGA